MHEETSFDRIASDAETAKPEDFQPTPEPVLEGEVLDDGDGGEGDVPPEPSQPRSIAEQLVVTLNHTLNEGGSAQARCPICEDQYPSVLINPATESGLIHAKCCKGCAQAELYQIIREHGFSFLGDKPSKTSNIKAIMPAPDTLPLPEVGDEEVIFVYRTDDPTKVQHLVRRFVGDDGEKVVLPMVAVDVGGQVEWKAGWPSTETRRVPFNLDELAARPKAPVIIWEGEKACCAAMENALDPTARKNGVKACESRIAGKDYDDGTVLEHIPQLADYVHTTLSGGTNTIGHHDLRAFRNRVVFIAMDNDEAGLKFAERLAVELVNIGAHSVYCLRSDQVSGLPKKWDIADGLNKFRVSWARYFAKAEIWEQAYQVWEDEDGNNRHSWRESFPEKFAKMTSERDAVYIQKSNPMNTYNETRLARQFGGNVPVERFLKDIARSPHVHAVDGVGIFPEAELGGIVEMFGGQYLNVFPRPRVGADVVIGDFKPFLRYMRFLIPDRRERRIFLHWCAVVVAGDTNLRPLEWCVQLVSKTQGVGKSTVVRIFQQLLGKNFVATPGVDDLQSDKNGYLKNARLVAVQEIVGGPRFTTYQKLKDVITEPTIRLREMRKDVVTIPNNTYVLMNSNHFDALKVEYDDRRVFAPTVTEQKPSECGQETLFPELWAWLDDGGYDQLMVMAQRYARRVRRVMDTPEAIRMELTRHAPVSSGRDRMRAATRSDAEIVADALLDEVGKNDVLVVNDWNAAVRAEVEAQGGKITEIGVGKRINDMMEARGWRRDQVRYTWTPEGEKKARKRTVWVWVHKDKPLVGKKAGSFKDRKKFFTNSAARDLGFPPPNPTPF